MGWIKLIVILVVALWVLVQLSRLIVDVLLGGRTAGEKMWLRLLDDVYHNKLSFDAALLELKRHGYEWRDDRVVRIGRR